MRLLVDARVGWGHGIGRVITNTVPRVAALRPDWRLRVLVNTPDLHRAREAFGTSANVEIVACDVRPFSLAEQVRLASFARGCALTWFTNYWVPLGWRGRFVTTVHDLLHLKPELTPASRINRRLARLTFTKVRRQAAAVMFDSRFTQAEFEAMVGIPRRGVTVPLGGDHLPTAVVAKQRSLLAVAAPKKHKNFALLLDAWRQAAVPPGWTLRIVAPADAMRSTIDLEAMASSARVAVYRGISNAELADLYAAAAIVLTPSLYEGFGLPLLEAMLAGALCVSSTAGSMVEVAEGAFVSFVNGRDRAGWTSAIEQACVTIDRDELDLQAVLAHNRRRAQRFRWDDTARQIADILADAVSRPVAGARNHAEGTP